MSGLRTKVISLLFIALCIPLLGHAQGLANVSASTIARLAPVEKPNLPAERPAKGLSQSDSGFQARLVESYGQLPLSFEVNQGQTDRRVKFLSRGGGYTLFLTATEAVLSLSAKSARAAETPSSWDLRDAKRNLVVPPIGLPPSGQGMPPLSVPFQASRRGDSFAPYEQTVVRMELVGANPSPSIEALDELPGKSNYFIGNDPKKWRTDVPHYARVRYREVYPGVDLLYYGNQRRLEHDFVLAPGADPGKIVLTWEGTDRMSVADDGDLVLETPAGEVRLQKPVIYQAASNRRRIVAGGYRITAKNQIGFAVGAYDSTQPLVIDPAFVLAYSTYLGGSGSDVFNSDILGVIAVDSAGNAYVAGATASTDFPTTNPIQATNAGVFDAFVTKLNAAGAAVYSTYLGGSGVDAAVGIAVDSSGNAYLTGVTDSTNFPTVNAFQPALAPLNCSCSDSDAFVTKLNAAGNALVYSTYLGGGGGDGGLAIAVDAFGSAYVTGVTGTLIVPSNFPTTANAFQPALAPSSNFEQSTVFVTKFTPAGNALVYSTYLGESQGGTGQEALGIAVDSSGNAYVTGITSSPTFPTANAFQPTLGSPDDGFLAKLNAAGSGLVYSTFLGGEGLGVAVDSAGNAYVTSAPLLVRKLTAAGSPVYSFSFVSCGGCLPIVPLGITVDSAGSMYVSGFGDGNPFGSQTSAFRFGVGGLSDAVVAKLNAAGTALDWFGYLGGSGFDTSNRQGLAVDACGNVYVAGGTGGFGNTPSTDFPTTPGAFQPAFGGGDSDVFVSKIAVLAPQVQPPINPDGSSVFNASRGVIPVKYAVAAACSQSLPAATIALVRTSGGSPGPVNQSDFTLPSDTGSNFRINGSQYVYNLDTGSFGAGTYLVQISVSGSVVGSATFGLQ